MAAGLEFTIRELDAPLGAEITGFDATLPLSTQRFDALRRAILAHQLLVFRDCALTPESQIVLSRRFGTLPPHYQKTYHDDANPEIFIITNLDATGTPIVRNPDPTSSLWHIDGSWQPRRGSYTLLHGIEVPRRAGDTQFANTYLAYDRLPPARRHYLESLVAVHDLAWSVSTSNPAYVWAEGQEAAAPKTRQPVVQRHGETGRKAIYLGQHAASIEGLSWQEGRALIDEINVEASGAEVVHSHRWAPGDLVIWDNRCTMHRSMPYDYAAERRLVHRTSVFEDAAA